jgi:hypothetical protein
MTKVAHTRSSVWSGRCVYGGNYETALEINTTHDTLVRILEQLLEASAHGYHQHALITTMKSSRRMKPDVFNRARGSFSLASIRKAESAKSILTKH